MHKVTLLPSVQTLKIVPRVSPSEALATFRSLKAPPKPLKFEYLRMYLYRRMKRTLRRWIKSEIMRIDGVKLEEITEEYSEKLREIETICQLQIEQIEDFVDKTKSPKVDHKDSGIDVPYTTYSNKYIASVLRCNAVARVYTLYVELVFGSLESEKLRKYWKIGCCEGEHTEGCTGKWALLRDTFLQEVEVYKNRSLVFTQVEGLVSI